ncbi:hypothetical protein GCM10027300_13540 [Modestobacter lapidis]
MTDPLTSREQEIQALGMAWSSLSRSHRRRAAVLEYYCQQRDCPLLTCFQTPRGLLVWLPQYRRSASRNAAESAASARARRTLDGDRRWKPRVFEVDQIADPLLPEQVGVQLNCDHLTRFVSGGLLLGDMRKGRPGAPFTLRL